MKKKHQQKQEEARRGRERKRLRHVAPTPPSPQATKHISTEEPSQHRLKLRGPILAWFLGTMTTLGGIYVLYDLRPVVDISYSGSMNARIPFEAVFKVNNAGRLFTLRNMKVTCSLNNVETTSHWAIEGFKLDTNKTIFFQELKSGESATVKCPFDRDMGGAGPVSYADISLSVEYDIPLYWKRLKRSPRFIGRFGSDGEAHWTQEPSIDP